MTAQNRNLNFILPSKKPSQALQLAPPLQTASVIGFFRPVDSTKYYYTIYVTPNTNIVTLSSTHVAANKPYRIHRRFEDFLELHKTICAQLKKEYKSLSACPFYYKLPNLPGRKVWVTKATVEERWPQLDTYVRQVLTEMPEKVTKSLVVAEFFGLRKLDIVLTTLNDPRLVKETVVNGESALCLEELLGLEVDVGDASAPNFVTLRRSGSTKRDASFTPTSSGSTSSSLSPSPLPTSANSSNPPIGLATNAAPASSSVLGTLTRTASRKIGKWFGGPNLDESLPPSSSSSNNAPVRHVPVVKHPNIQFAAAKRQQQQQQEQDQLLYTSQKPTLLDFLDDYAMLSTNEPRGPPLSIPDHVKQLTPASSRSSSRNAVPFNTATTITSSPKSIETPQTPLPSIATTTTDSLASVSRTPSPIDPSSASITSARFIPEAPQPLSLQIITTNTEFLSPGTSIEPELTTPTPAMTTDEAVFTFDQPDNSTNEEMMRGLMLRKLASVPNLRARNLEDAEILDEQAMGTSLQDTHMNGLLSMRDSVETWVNDPEMVLEKPVLISSSTANVTRERSIRKIMNATLKRMNTSPSASSSSLVGNTEELLESQNQQQQLMNEELSKLPPLLPTTSSPLSSSVRTTLPQPTTNSMISITSSASSSITPRTSTTTPHIRLKIIHRFSGTAFLLRISPDPTQFDFKEFRTKVSTKFIAAGWEVSKSQVTKVCIKESSVMMGGSISCSSFSSTQSFNHDPPQPRIRSSQSSGTSSPFSPPHNPQRSSLTNSDSAFVLNNGARCSVGEEVRIVDQEDWEWFLCEVGNRGGGSGSGSGSEKGRAEVVVEVMGDCQN